MVPPSGEIPSSCIGEPRPPLLPLRGARIGSGRPSGGYRITVPEQPSSPVVSRHLAAVLFDRDGTLVHDVPYNGDPTLVTPVPTARAAVGIARDAGLRLGIVTNQRGVALGRLTRAQVDAVNARVTELLGPFDGIAVCPHDTAAGCGCRKPRPGMVLELAARWGVDPADCAVIGDTAADVGAAEAVGGIGVLVPNPATAPHEVVAARWTAPDLLTAVRMLVGAPTSR